MNLKRQPSLDTDHPFSSLASAESPATAEPQPAPAPKASKVEEPAKPARETSSATGSKVGSADPYAGRDQLNIRASAEMRAHMRQAVAGMTLVTGEKWSQDRLIRQAVAAYLTQLGDEYNDGKPFHER